MFIRLPPESFRTYNWIGLIRLACDKLSDLNVTNYVHQLDENNCIVELVDLGLSVTPVIDFVHSGIHFDIPD